MLCQNRNGNILTTSKHKKEEMIYKKITVNKLVLKKFLIHKHYYRNIHWNLKHTAFKRKLQLKVSK